MELNEANRKPKGRASFLLGLGLDGKDGHVRVTRGKDLLLLGGSENTHEVMQEKVIKLGEVLHRRGKTLHHASADEMRDILHELSEK